MKQVRIEVLPARDGDTVMSAIVVERERAGRWIKIEEHIVKSNTSRVLLLEDDERIVVEANVQSVLVVDKEQNSVKEVRAVVGAPTAEEVLIGPLPPGSESQIGVWREKGERKDSRTGKRYRTY